MRKKASGSSPLVPRFMVLSSAIILVLTAITLASEPRAKIEFEGEPDANEWTRRDKRILTEYADFIVRSYDPSEAREADSSRLSKHPWLKATLSKTTVTRSEFHFYIDSAKADRRAEAYILIPLLQNERFDPKRLAGALINFHTFLPVLGHRFGEYYREKVSQEFPEELLVCYHYLYNAYFVLYNARPSERQWIWVPFVPQDIYCDPLLYSYFVYYPPDDTVHEALFFLEDLEEYEEHVNLDFLTEFLLYPVKVKQ